MPGNGAGWKGEAMRIAIIGAGIGGLAAALSLHDAGYRDIRILERAPEIRGLGVGINLLPHAMRELSELGLGERIERIGVAPHALSYRNHLGQEIWTEPRGTAAGYAWPQLSVHRGRLQLELRDAVRERLGDVIELDRRLVDARTAPGAASVIVEGSAGSETIEADVVIAADGIHSAVRRLRHPADPGPQWSGVTLWRGTAHATPFLDGATMIMAGDADQRFVAYPIESPGADGRARINVIAELREAGTAGADWNRSVPAGPIVERFRDWRFDWLDVPALIAGCDELLEYPMVDLDPLDQWSEGRLTLVGDAAHAMYPQGSNGASQAIIDGRVLAMHLATESDPVAALAAYERDRRPAMAALLESNRAGGPERVMRLAAARAPQGFDRIEDAIPHAELVEVATSFKKAAGFDPQQLRERPSYSRSGAAR